MNESRTTRMIRNKSRSDGPLVKVPQRLLDDPTFIPRLTWRGGFAAQTAEDQIKTINGAGDAAFFADNSFFDDRLDDRICEALLAQRGRLFLTPRVIDELLPWLKRRPKHPLNEAIRRHDPAIVLYNEPGGTGKAVFTYYIALLGARRRMLERRGLILRSHYGREPTEDEESAYRVEFQKFAGERGMLLAKKSGGKGADEALVYLAVEHALATGRQSAILTRDEDIHEQLYKLLWLIETHYRSMLLGDLYVKLSGALKPRPLRVRDGDEAWWPFERDGAVLIERGGPSPDMRHLLPEHFRFVAIACETFRDGGVSHNVFSAEQEMRRVLQVKERTGGLSSDRLGSRNIHASLAPLEIPHEDRLCGAVVRDRRLPLKGSTASTALLDMIQATADFESHGEIDPVPEPGTPFLPSRP